MYDVVIIGGGPAGSTLARLLGGKLNVLILDQRELGRPFAGGFEKCCGGLLAPDAQEMLARFGLGLPETVLAGPQLFAVRTIDLVSGQQRYYPRHYINVQREAFDRWLISLLPPQVETLWGAHFLGFSQGPEDVEISYLRAGQRQKARARLLVGADGALSRVRAGLKRTSAPRAYVAVQEWFEAIEPLPYFTAAFDPAITDFYAWMIPKDQMLLVGAAIPEGADVLSKFELLKHKLLAQGFDLGNSVRRRGTSLLRPLASRGLNRGAGQVALIGEAAGWISPSSAEGISYAFRSALALARALDKGCDGALPRYRLLTRDLALNIWGKTVKSPAMYWPLLRRLAMGSGLLSIDIID
jgi:flavin-dependent dehydrogenase